jgi:hypothetical protein
MSSSSENEVAFPDFFPAAQNDFAARMDWSVQTSFSSANHPPLIRIEGKKELKAQPGQTIHMKAVVSDPDGDEYSIKWWQFRKRSEEPVLSFTGKKGVTVKVKVPDGASPGQTVYVVVQAEDRRKTPLTRYQILQIEL